MYGYPEPSDPSFDARTHEPLVEALVEFWRESRSVPSQKVGGKRGVGLFFPTWGRFGVITLALERYLKEVDFDVLVARGKTATIEILSKASNLHFHYWLALPLTPCAAMRVAQTQSLLEGLPKIEFNVLLPHFYEETVIEKRLVSPVSPIRLGKNEDLNLEFLASYARSCDTTVPPREVTSPRFFENYFGKLGPKVLDVLLDKEDGPKPRNDLIKTGGLFK